ncbi:hypothetical protein RM572_08765 [Streptomyces sp. DSM 42041]|uniref:Uncharacterized protein n=1 Tax=Streptomyces hazeniae TaxID=3075538 RepID=A0ABU2NRK6_9ACTN|nr:hypothetical protein [Streptomyces sp. DSM 42041]MDT0378863.1 hypothetical protein [Streptomyces sp. DSM 42041]
MRRRFTGATLGPALLLALIAKACALLTGRHRRWAGRAADRVYPGLLHPFEATTAFPASLGSRVRFAVEDNPDAEVILGFEPRVMKREPACFARELTQTLNSARALADDWRHLG